MKKIHFISLGCARNFSDTEMMVNLLLKHSYQIATDIQSANYIVVNTCGFLEESRNEALDVLKEVFQFKNKLAKVIVTGCMVNLFKTLLKDNFNDIYYFLGSGDLEKIVEVINLDQKGEIISKNRSFLGNNLCFTPKILTTSPNFSYLKIAEGCKKGCSFCLIPKIKGPLKSKDINHVLKEFDQLLSQGVFEIILIAQDLGDFGKDKKLENGLNKLLIEMLKRKGKFWIRLLYLYPDEITDELIDIIKSDKRICPYVDMPIQHINDEILKSMNRNITKKQIISIIEKLRKKIPDISIRTSLMVGYPGETNEQFDELVNFVRECKFENVGIFKYSKEKLTKSFNLQNQISEELKNQRHEDLAKVQYEIVEEKNKSHIGKKFDVIIEGYHPESEMLAIGRSRYLAPDVDGLIIINDISKVKEFGRVYKVEVTNVASYDLIGKII
jgi:ribosomal protein S12 methylthiotransferase